MPFVTFDLERWQGTWENQVRYNLSESGVHPLSIAELLDLSGGSVDAFTALRMVYSQSDGTEELRAAIAALYPGATPNHVTVTVGSSEANFIACWTLIERGDRVVVVTPTYMQTHGLARNFGAEVVELPLRPERRWQPDPAEIARAITPGTKLVVVTNPNNPTGQILADDASAVLLDRVRATGAWLLADEVYRGAERQGAITPSFWGGAERVLAVNGLSKAYGLPGLRIGWIVSSPEFKQSVVRRHDYTVIGPSPASDYLARRALGARERIQARTRRILNTNWPTLERWLTGFDGLFDWIEPAAGAICMVRYRTELGALDLVEQIRARHGILLVPGDHFDLPRHLRLGYGNEPDEFAPALRDLATGVRSVLMD